MEPLKPFYSPTAPLSYECGRPAHLSRRRLLSCLGAAGLAWMTPLSRLLAEKALSDKSGRPPKSVILLWLAGGASQLETFDPQENSSIAYGTRSMGTSVEGVRLAAGMERTAAVMEHVSLIRSMTSREGDHERAIYNIKTGYRPEPAIVHPSIGAVLTHELNDPSLDIPQHISILPNEWPARGGYLGAHLDAFQMGDPAKPSSDVVGRVSTKRMDRRLRGLERVESTFAKGRSTDSLRGWGVKGQMMDGALRMMRSDQLKAFDLSQATRSERDSLGETAFGRGCLVAARLIEAGVRCVEVTLKGWDSHVNNHEIQASRVATLDPAFAGLINYLKERELLDQTLVLCGTEFGRTPQLNPLEGRDHWPKGFSIALAGGGVVGGQVIGETDPTGESEEPADPVRVEDVHATVQQALGIDYEKVIETPVGRPIALSEGRVIRRLIGES